MINISEIKIKLMKLCDGTYSRGDVDYIVEILRTEAEKYLATRLFKLKKTTSPEIYRKTLSDHAWDLIGPLLGRNPSGCFTILNDYFSNFKNVSEADYFTAFNKFIYTRFHSELIRQIEETDPFGKAFERTLTYLLKKNPHWNKSNKGQYRILTGPEYAGAVATESDVRSAFQGVDDRAFSRYIEKGLKRLLEDWSLQVNMSELRTYIRGVIESDIPVREDRTESSPDLELTKSIIVKETVREVDRSILQKYLHAEKLVEAERLAFQKSIELLLTELGEYAGTRNHADYLSLFLPGGITVEDYRIKYRPQFEYAVREARDIFSAKMRKIINT